MGKVGAEGDGLELLAHLHTLAATYAADLALLGGKGSLVLVVAEDHNLAVLGSLGNQFDNATGTGLGTGAATGTLALVHLGNAGGGIYGDGTKQAHAGTIALAKTAILALGLAHTGHVLHLARMSAVEFHSVGAHVACTLATDHSHLGCCCRCLQAEYAGNLLHHCLAARGTVQFTQTSAFGCLDAC